MNKNKYTIIVIFILFCAVVYAEQETTSALDTRSITEHFLIGYQYGGLLGEGAADNTFDMGSGFIIEISSYNQKGLGFTVGTNVYWSKNKVGNEKASIHYYIPFYLDFRKFSLKSQEIKPFISLGTGWGRLHINNTKGSDNQWLISLGWGVHVPAGKDGAVIQVMFKPYFVVSNDLKQSLGMETHIAYGLKL